MSVVYKEDLQERLRKLRDDMRNVDGPEHDSYYGVVELIEELMREFGVDPDETKRMRKKGK
jgi:hypothetical protein